MAGKRGRRFEDAERGYLVERVGTLAARGLPERTIARRLSISKGMVGTLKKEAVTAPQPPSSPVSSPAWAHVRELDASVPKGKVQRFVVGMAGRGPLPAAFLDNLWAFAAHKRAEFFVGGDPKHARQCPGELRPYFCPDRVRLNDSLLFVGHGGNADAVEPLKDHVSANRGQHVVVAHPRFALQSIPRMLDAPPRYTVSTGAVTFPAPDASVKALRHHALGALLVEVDADGECFFHQISAYGDGSFQCLDEFVADGRVHVGRRVRAITWGDAHHAIMQRAVGIASFGYDRAAHAMVGGNSLLDSLQPEDQFFSDLVHFGDRNTHVISDPVRLAQSFHAGRGNIEAEIAAAAGFVNLCRRDWTRVHLKEGNHERKLVKWLKDSKGRSDPENAYYYHRLNAVMHSRIRETRGAWRETRIVEHALREAGLADDVEFRYRDRSCVIDGVELGVHSDKGIKGSPGTPAQFRKHGGRITLDHPHTPWACEGVYVAGTTGEIYQGYNDGWTTDAHAHVVQYHGGHRALVLMASDGRHRATADLPDPCPSPAGA